MTVSLPARFDHVGSFLRPEYLLHARQEQAKGAIQQQNFVKSKTKPLRILSIFRPNWV